MRSIIPATLEFGRVGTGPLGSYPRDGLAGAFQVPGPTGQMLRIIASSGEGWEHVSVSLPNRCPNWPEMCFVKDLFWGEEEEVIQFHPKRSEYVNCHPNCLHMWKLIGVEFPTPPSHLVGPKVKVPA